jgi:uncharacterized protein
MTTKVKLSEIPESGELTEKDLALPLAELGLAEPWIGKSVSLSYSLRKIHGKILGNFRCSGGLGLECSRCLEPFEARAKAEFLANFEEEPEEVNPRSGIDPEDPGLNVVFFKDGLIEFGEELRQEMELQVPFAPLCREDCLGLCPVCGGNRNQKPCDCADKPANNPFHGLNKLFQQNKEN